VALIVRKAGGGVREMPERVRLDPEQGIPGDAWGRRRHPDPVAQLAVMELAVAELIANGQPIALFGDNLYLDLDLSASNLPPGTRLRAGECILEVTPKPHNGCSKFRGRFGPDSVLFASRADLRHRNLRGIYMRVIEAGEVGPGDTVEVLSRPGRDSRAAGST
jgi:MOSC domain-containing protein YiiM